VFTRDFTLFLVSRFCVATGMTMIRAAVGWHVFELSGSAFYLGLLGLVFLPVLPVTLFAGVVADAFDRKRILLTIPVVPLSCAALLAWSSWSGGANLPLLYCAILLIGFASAFDNPARSALLPTLVPREVFPRAVSVAATNQALAFMTGPAVGGLVIAAFGIGAAYAVFGGFILTAAIAIAFVRPGAAERERSPVSWRAIREGLAFVRSEQVILGCMALDMFAVIFGGASALLPVYAKEILQVGPRGFGALSASMEVGALLMSLGLMLRPPIRRAGRALLVTVSVFGLAMIVFGLSRWFPLSVLALVAAGMADQVSVVLRHTVVQLNTPDALRGRVSSVNLMFIGASNQLGAAESGFVAALTSATFSVVSGGVGCLLVVAIVAWTMPRLRRYEVRMTTL